MDDVEGCLACDLAWGRRPLVGGVCLWSHGPVHIHFVVQPVDRALAERIDARGPRLQAAMFDSEPMPDDAAVERFAAAARHAFT